jgi:hypothetical protein
MNDSDRPAILLEFDDFLVRMGYRNLCPDSAFLH